MSSFLIKKLDIIVSAIKQTYFGYEGCYFCRNISKMIKNYPNAVDFSKTKGYFGIGIENALQTQNIGTIWRSAQIMGADFIFIIGGIIKE